MTLPNEQFERIQVGDRIVVNDGGFEALMSHAESEFVATVTRPVAGGGWYAENACTLAGEPVMSEGYWVPDEILRRITLHVGDTIETEEQAAALPVGTVVTTEQELNRVRLEGGWSWDVNHTRVNHRVDFSNYLQGHTVVSLPDVSAEPRWTVGQVVTVEEAQTLPPGAAIRWHETDGSTCATGQLIRTSDQGRWATDTGAPASPPVEGSQEWRIESLPSETDSSATGTLEPGTLLTREQAAALPAGSVVEWRQPAGRDDIRRTRDEVGRWRGIHGTLVTDALSWDVEDSGTGHGHYLVSVGDGPVPDVPTQADDRPAQTSLYNGQQPTAAFYRALVFAVTRAQAMRHAVSLEPVVEGLRALGLRQSNGPGMPLVPRSAVHEADDAPIVVRHTSSVYLLTSGLHLPYNVWIIVSGPEHMTEVPDLATTGTEEDAAQIVALKTTLAEHGARLASSDNQGWCGTYEEVMRSIDIVPWRCSDDDRNS